MNQTLIAIDIDGTLIGEDLTISREDRLAIGKATRDGHIVCLASGRLLAASRPYADELGLQGPIIVLQGAVAYDLATQERLFCTALDLEIALFSYDYLKARGFHMQLYYGDSLYLDAMNHWAQYYIALSRVEPIMVPDLRDLLAGTPPSDPGPIKLLAIAEPERVASTIPKLGNELEGRANVFKSLPPFLEVTNLDADKGHALRRLAARCGIAMADTAAIGDSDNDVPMFEVAARSFVVANGTNAAKASARVVVPALGTGVARALQLLEEERAHEPA